MTTGDKSLTNGHPASNNNGHTRYQLAVGSHQLPLTTCYLPLTIVNTQPKESDCIIIGGGIIGMLTARELRMAGMAVTLIDRQPSGNPPGPEGAFSPRSIPGVTTLL